MINKPETGKVSVSKKKVTAKKKVSQTNAVSKKVVAKKVVSRKTTSKKAPTSKKTSAASTTSNPLVSPRERYKMIETMAYYRAEKRNFAPGKDEQDWFECEQIIDDMLNKK